MLQSLGRPNGGGTGRHSAVRVYIGQVYEPMIGQVSAVVILPFVLGLSLQSTGPAGAAPASEIVRTGLSATGHRERAACRLAHERSLGGGLATEDKEGCDPVWTDGVERLAGQLLGALGTDRGARSRAATWGSRNGGDLSNVLPAVWRGKSIDLGWGAFLVRTSYDSLDPQIAGVSGYDPTKVNTDCPTIPTSDFVPVQPGTTSVDGPEGQAFVFEPGVYRGLSVRPKDGQKFYARAGVKMVGDEAEFAFFGDAKDVYICGFEITDYKSDYQRMAIHAQMNAESVYISDGWVIENVDVHHNRYGGIMCGDDCVVRNSKIRDNDVIGIGASDSINAVFDNIEVVRNGGNNSRGWGHEGGGSKLARSTGARVVNSYFGRNVGPGIWFDIENSQALIAGNLVEDNDAMGIFWELNQASAIIRNNAVINNGHRDTCGWEFRCSGIYLSSAHTNQRGLIEVYDNIVAKNRFAITATTDDRRQVGDAYIHDNIIIDSGRSGASKGSSELDVLWHRISWENNCYQDYSDDGVFDWKERMDWAAWRAVGHDESGRFNPHEGC